MKEHHLYKSVDGQVLLEVPKSLICNYLAYICCVKKKFGKYLEMIKMGSDTFDSNLDLIFLTKRLKMHAITFYKRISSKERRLSAMLANWRPL